MLHALSSMDQKEGRIVPLRIVQRCVIAFDLLSQCSRFRKQENAWNVCLV